MTGHIERCEDKIKKLVCSWSNKYEPDLRAALEELVAEVQEDDAFWNKHIVPTLERHAWPFMTDALIRISKLTKEGGTDYAPVIARVALIESGLAGINVEVTEQTKPPSGGAATGQTEDKATEPVAPSYD